jgi:aspartate aminotransferase-like enzyme
METVSRSVYDSALNRQLQVLREVLATQPLNEESVEALERLARNLVERGQRLRRLGQMLKGQAELVDLPPGEPTTPDVIKATVERSDEQLLRELPGLIERLRLKPS